MRAGVGVRREACRTRCPCGHCAQYVTDCRPRSSSRRSFWSRRRIPLIPVAPALKSAQCTALAHSLAAQRLPSSLPYLALEGRGTVHRQFGVLRRRVGGFSTGAAERASRTIVAGVPTGRAVCRDGGAGRTMSRLRSAQSFRRSGLRTSPGTGFCPVSQLYRSGFSMSSTSANSSSSFASSFDRLDAACARCAA